jgi:hypothetical protein
VTHDETFLQVIIKSPRRANHGGTMRHRLALLLLASGLTAGMVALDALWPTQTERPLHGIQI